MRWPLPILVAALALGSCAEHPAPGDPDAAIIGVASYYAHKFHGRETASGEIYDETALTAAHRRLPFGTLVRVTNLVNGRSVVLRINDRGPFVEGRVIDVSYRAARELDFVEEGLARVRLEVAGIAP
jgi:rare lipoprotein A